MNAVTAFENRKDALREQLKAAGNEAQAVAAVTMTLEQIACDLAQGEPNDLARQRQLAVLALARRLPRVLRAAHAQGQLVVRENAEMEKSLARKVCLGALGGGMALLIGLAVYASIRGNTAVLLLQAVGMLLFYIGAARVPRESGERMEAQGILCIDAQDMVRQVGEICQAVDVCVSDLTLIDRDRGAARLTGTVDEAMLDLLAAMMEAKASGREDMAVRMLRDAEQYLRMMGVDAVMYDGENAEMFDVLPTLGDTRTVRPALVRDGRVLRRGVAAAASRAEEGADERMRERGMGA